MKFSQIAKGKRARRRVEFPLWGDRPEGLAEAAAEVVEQRKRDKEAWAAKPEAERPPEPPDAVVEFDLCVLTGAEDSEALAEARKYAIGKGVSEPRSGEPNFDLGLMVHRLALACLDKDSPEDRPAKFFDGGPTQILGELNRDQIAFIHELQETWQDECSPYVRTIGADKLISHCLDMGVSEDERPFVQLSPGLRLKCTRFLAKQFAISLMPKLPSSSDSETSGPRSSETSESASAESPQNNASI